jgi:hypothetical protein
MSNSRNPHLAERLLIAVRRAAQGEGVNPNCRFYLVIDGEHCGRGTGSCGDMDPARIRLLVDRMLSQHNSQTFEAVRALSKHTLNGIPPHLQLKTNG